MTEIFIDLPKKVVRVTQVLGGCWKENIERIIGGTVIMVEDERAEPLI